MKGNNLHIPIPGRLNLKKANGKYRTTPTAIQETAYKNSTLTGSRKGATTKYTQQSRTRTGITGGI